MKKILYNFGSICLMLFLILFSVFTVVNEPGFYSRQYVQNGADKDTGMSFEDLDKATVMLLDYLNDKRDDLDMQAEEFGKMAETFDEREKSHMVDVKALYQNFATVMYILLGAVAVIFIYLFVKDRQNFLTGLQKGCTTALIIAVVLCVAFSLAYTAGFNTFWTMFHKVMFSNDLWLLDPRVSTMINMFPLNFWLAMCSKMLVRFAVLYFALFTSVKVLKQYYSRKAGV